MQVFSVLFSISNIGQSTPYPYVVNALTITLKTNFPLTKETSLTIFPLVGATIDQDVDPGYTEQDGHVTLIGPNKDLFVPARCPSSGTCPNAGFAKWQSDSKTLVFFLAGTTVVDAEYVLEWRVRNPGRGQISPLTFIEVGIESQRFEALQVCLIFGVILSNLAEEAKISNGTFTCLFVCTIQSLAEGWKICNSAFVSRIWFAFYSILQRKRRFATVR